MDLVKGSKEVETAVSIEGEPILTTTVACPLLVVLYVEAARGVVGFPLRLFFDPWYVICGWLPEFDLIGDGGCCRDRTAAVRAWE